MTTALLISCAAILEGLVLYIDVRSDFNFWKKGEYINHSNQGFKRMLLLLPSTVFYTVPILWGVDWWIILLCGVISFAMIGFRYWILFDGFYSNKRRFNFWHLGSDDPGDGVLDNFLQSLTRLQHITIKAGGAMLFLIVYILLL